MYIGFIHFHVYVLWPRPSFLNCIVLFVYCGPININEAAIKKLGLGVKIADMHNTIANVTLLVLNSQSDPTIAFLFIGSSLVNLTQLQKIVYPYTLSLSYYGIHSLRRPPLFQQTKKNTQL